MPHERNINQTAQQINQNDKNANGQSKQTKRPKKIHEPIRISRQTQRQNPMKTQNKKRTQNENLKIFKNPYKPSPRLA